jgi:septal ring factor EnvC (AmiA/AmiB activator)
MPDTLITAILSICLIGMTALGIYVSFVPLNPTDKKVPVIRRRSVIVSVAFVLLTALIITLSVIQTQRAGKQQDAANNKISELTVQVTTENQKLEKTQTSLHSSLLETEFMKGQLESLGRKVTTLDYDGKTAASNNAAILEQLRDAQNEQLSHLPALQRMSNKELNETVNAFSKRLISEERRLEKLDDEIGETQARFSAVTNPSQDQKRALAELAAKRRAWSDELLSTISQESSLATAYRDELMRRLGENVARRLNWPSEDDKPLREERLFGYALYLEEMAQKLST